MKAGKFLLDNFKFLISLTPAQLDLVIFMIKYEVKIKDMQYIYDIITNSQYKEATKC